MDPKYILEALLEIWDELPFLVGMEAWTGLYHQIEPLFQQIQEAQSEDERDLAGAALVTALAGQPMAQRRLRQAVEHIRTERSSNGSPREAPPWERLLALLESFVHPPTATRYTDILAPRRIQRGKRAPVTVSLTVGPEATSQASEALGVQEGRSIEISLRALSPGLEIDSAPLQRLRTRPGGDSKPAPFVIKGTRLGRQTLAIDFHQKGRHAGHVELPVEVIREVPADEDVHDVAGPAFGERHILQPADLEIIITLEQRERNGPKIWRYMLHSPNRIAPFHQQSVDGPPILGDAEQYRAHLMARLENLQGRRDAEGHPLLLSEISDKLAGLGRDLYRELFAGEMQTAYRRFRKTVRTIQITTADPWIPWEILRPYDDSDPDPERLVNDDFLCCQFQVTRWLSGSRVPAGEVRAAQLACIQVGEAPKAAALPHAQAESQLLADLAVAYGLRNASPPVADAESLKSLLSEGGTQILHFVSHGDFLATQPDASSLLLADGSRFRAEDLQGPLATGLSKDRPLVFFNACRLGQQGWSLSGLGGWPERWVRICGCGAFIAPLWAVSDRWAFELAKAFYGHLEEGGTFGAAAQEARRKVRELAGDNPTWMAYVVYAHPNGRLGFVPGEGA